MVGKRVDPPPRAAISSRIQEQIEKARAQHGKAAPKAKPVATPARSSTPPPTTKKAPPTPPTAGSKMSVDSPVVTSPPINPPEFKRMRSVASLASETSSVPSLPSFSASSYKQTGPRHSDTASTIAVEFANMTISGQRSQDLLGFEEKAACCVCTQLCADENEIITKASKTFCSLECFMKGSKTGGQDMAPRQPEAEPEVPSQPKEAVELHMPKEVPEVPSNPKEALELRTPNETAAVPSKPEDALELHMPKEVAVPSNPKEAVELQMPNETPQGPSKRSRTGDAAVTKPLECSEPQTPSAVASVHVTAPASPSKTPVLVTASATKDSKDQCHVTAACSAEIRGSAITASAKAGFDTHLDTLIEEDDDIQRQLEAEVERELYQEAVDRATEAETRANMLQDLLAQVLNSSCLDAAKGPEIRAMLRRPATADIDAATVSGKDGLQAPPEPETLPTENKPVEEEPAKSAETLAKENKPVDEEPAKPAETLAKENKPVDEEPAKPAETLAKENKPVDEEPAKPAETLAKENKPVDEEPAKPAETLAKENKPVDEEPAKPAETLSKENKPVDQEPAKPAETLPKENKPVNEELAKPVNEEPAKPAETPPKENKPVKEEPQKETKVTPSKVTSTKRIEPSSPKSVKEEPVTGRSAEAAHTTPAQAGQDQALQKEAHRTYMRYYRSIRSDTCPEEVRKKIFDCRGKSRGPKVMKHYYEVFLSAKEDWMKSSIMMNISSKKRGKRTGLYVWKKYAELMKEHGEAVAADLATSKKKADPSGSGKWWKKHPDRPEAQDWELFKVFDGKTEVSESEDEVAFELSGGGELDEGMTHGAMSQILGGTGSSGSTENPREKDDIPKPKTPKTVKQAAEALFKKVTLKLSEAESIETMLKKGGMSAAMLEAGMKDLKPHVDCMQKEKKNLRASIDGEVPEDQMVIVVNHMTEVIARYDDQLKLAKRSLPKQAKATGKKAKTDPKAAAAS